VAKRAFCFAGMVNRETGIMGYTLERPKSRFQSCLPINEHHCTVLELFAGDSLCLKPKTVAVKLERFPRSSTPSVITRQA
jgi:hypothetical protein